MNPLFPIIDLVIIGNNEPIITAIIDNDGTIIIGNNDVITEAIIGNNRSNNNTTIITRFNSDVIM